MQLWSRRAFIPFSVCISTSLLLRALIGLHSYSGHANPPQYGDYEAQRHWMEVTVNLPAADWYKNTNDNFLGYWGLDYPPLSAYQSWLCGKLLGLFDADAVALHSSRGYESDTSKAWMRMSVIAFDILVFFPSVVAAVLVFNGKKSSRTTVWSIVAALIQPAALLIDHGHFQYNNISLGLSAAAAAAVGHGWHLVGSCLFCLAFNHKHMTLYYAPAFFAHLLGWALQQRTASSKALAIGKLAAVVILTFALCWLPYLGSLQAIKEVLERLTPVRRGLFEDYVANFWCVSSLIIKWRRLFTQQALVKLAGVATLLGCLPSMVEQIRKPSKTGLLYCMANSAFSFYMFSYQVHEKSVLLVLLPVSLLASHEREAAYWLPLVASFSMYPLLKKDGLCLAYAAVLLAWLNLWPTWREAFMQHSESQVGIGEEKMKWAKILVIATFCCGVGVHALDILSNPPDKLPFLYDALIVTTSFGNLLPAALYLNYKQWQLSSQTKQRQSKIE